jgi:hypothetical protein
VLTFDVQYDRLHAEGMLSTEISEQDKRPAPLCVNEVRSRCRPYDVSRLYNDIKHFADYGTGYQRINAVSFHDDEALVEVRGLTDDTARSAVDD